jgi:methanogenic corrinoid protein MtbC1
VAFGPVELLDRLLVPLLREMGERWHSGAFSIAHEHLGTAVSRAVLETLKWRLEPVGAGPSIVVTTPAGQLHEVGALLAAVSAAVEGWRVVYLGPNLPAAEIASAAAGAHVKAVALSIVYPEDDSRMESELRELRRALPAGVALLAGGAAAARYAAVLDEVRAIRLPDLAALRTLLRGGRLRLPAG